jgi:hypothetical protein
MEFGPQHPTQYQDDSISYLDHTYTHDLHNNLTSPTPKLENQKICFMPMDYRASL